MVFVLQNIYNEILNIFLSNEMTPNWAFLVKDGNRLRSYLSQMMMLKVILLWYVVVFFLYMEEVDHLLF